MKLGILCTMLKRFSRKGQYNSQEIGLGRELASMGHSVIIWKGVDEEKDVEDVSLSPLLTVHYMTMPHLGAHGWFDCGKLDPLLDALLCFSDQQIFIPHVERFCRRNHIAFVPYIGTAHSLYEQSLHARIMNRVFAHTTLPVYRRIPVLAKTAATQEELRKLGVPDVQVAPVGLDVSALKQDYRCYDRNELRKEFHLTPADVVILTVSRLEPDKRPLDLIPIFLSIRGKKRFRLLIVGEGEQRAELEQEIHANGLEGEVQLLGRIPYGNMWKLYRISDYYLNISRNEIFGMSVMEAVYYEVSVAASDALGPSMTLKGLPGHCLAEKDEELAAWLTGPYPDAASLRESADRMVKKFSWRRTADEFLEVSSGERRQIVRETLGSYEPVCRILAEKAGFGLRTLLERQETPIQSKAAWRQQGRQAIREMFRRRKALSSAEELIAIGNYANLFLLAMNWCGRIRPGRLWWWGFFVHGERAQKILRMILRIILRPNVRFIVFSSYERTFYVRNLGIPESQLVSIPYGDWQNLAGVPGLGEKRMAKGETFHVDADGTVPGENEGGFPAKNSYWFSGGYSNRDYHLLIAAWEKFSKEDMPSDGSVEKNRGEGSGRRERQLVIIGSSNNPDLADYIHTHSQGSNGITVLLDQPRDVFDRYLSGAAGVILPFVSNTGASGQTVTLSGMIHHKLIIASDTDAMREYVIPGKTGILLNHFEQELPGAIQMAEENPQLCQAMLEEQTALFYRKFSYPVVEGRLLDVFGSAATDA